MHVFNNQPGLFTNIVIRAQNFIELLQESLSLSQIRTPSLQHSLTLVISLTAHIQTG